MCCLYLLLLLIALFGVSQQGSSKFKTKKAIAAHQRPFSPPDFPPVFSLDLLIAFFSALQQGEFKNAIKATREEISSASK
jgi:hypothetical protein